MQRWHLTAGLAGAVIVAAVVAPRLGGLHPGATPVPPAPPVPPIPTVVPPQPPQPPQPPVSSDSGHLTVDATLDRTAVLQGQGDERYLVVTVTAPPDIGTSTRRPVDVAVVMDVSGSMSARGKIDYAKRAAKLLATSMEPGDTYSLVTFSDDATTVIPATTVTDPTAITHAIDRIYEGGGTNLYAGLTKGAQEVERTLDDAHVGRVVLLSDGEANVGVTDPDALARFASDLAGHGVTMSAVGLGADYNEDLLARLADTGGGAYHFVDDPKQLETVFSEELRRSTSVVARGTEVRIHLPDGVTGLDVVGWDAVPASDGWTVDMGEVDAGDTRKIVCRVRVTGTGLGTMPVATVAADYQDVIDQAPGHASAEADATVTLDTRVVDGSTVRPAAVEAARVVGNSYLDQSSRAYAAGHVDEAKKLAAKGQAFLEDNARTYHEQQLEIDAQNLGAQQTNYDAYAPASEEGRAVVKQNKADYRSIAR